MIGADQERPLFRKMIQAVRPEAQQCAEDQAIEEPEADIFEHGDCRAGQVEGQGFFRLPCVPRKNCFPALARRGGGSRDDARLLLQSGYQVADRMYFRAEILRQRQVQHLLKAGEKLDAFHRIESEIEFQVHVRIDGHVPVVCLAQAGNDLLSHGASRQGSILRLRR